MDDEQLEREAAKILFSAPAKSEPDVTIRAQPSGPEVSFVCPFCQETYQVSEDLAGKKINCRNCREPSRVDAKKRKTPAPRFHAMSYWLGLLVGVVVTLCAVLWLKFFRIL